MAIKLNQTLPEIPICPDCGTSGYLEPKQVGDIIVYIRHYNCNCPEIREAKRQEAERKRKRQKRIENAIRNSCIYPYFQNKTFDNLDSIENLDACKKYVQEFKPGVSSGLQLIGNSRTGKSSLLAAMCNELIHNGYTCLYTTFADLLEKFAGYNSENYTNVYGPLEWIMSFDFVVLDDIGRIPISKYKANFAHMIVEKLKNEKIPVAISVDRKFFKELISNEHMKDTLSMLGEMCTTRLIFNKKPLKRKS